MNCRSFPREQEVAARIIEFLSGTLASASPEPIGLQTQLLEGGMLDSLGILQMMIFLGDKLGIEVGDEDFVAENFATVGSLAAFVVKKAEGKVG